MNPKPAMQHVRCPRFINLAKLFPATCRRAAGFALAAGAAIVFGVPAVAAANDSSEQTLWARGAYLATAADCVACHTGPAGHAPYAGGNPIDTPIGRIWSSNITPSKTYGIGSYTESQFTTALRQGIRADGARLYPAMPYTSYSQLSDDDVHALYAYFMHGVAPVDKAAPRTALPFPFNVRSSMRVWNLLFYRDARFEPDPSKSVEWNRGAYLADALAHCSTCHTPRNMLMAEDLDKRFGGGRIGNWLAPNISSDPLAGIGGWSQAELVAYLKTGDAPGRALAAGPMAEAIDRSLSKLTDSDLNALAVYMKSVPAVADNRVTKPAYSYGTAAHDEAQWRGIAVNRDASGAQSYSGNCASCHQASGEGNGAVPSLLHVSTVGRADPGNLVLAILDGVNRLGAQPRLMPGLRDELTDRDVAVLATYVSRRFGDPQASPITAGEVLAMREGVRSAPLVKITQYGVIIAGLIVLSILVVIGIVLWRR
jgi:mono/diheme cytochrome c family protein